MTPHRGASYYQGYGDGTGERWKAFGGALVRFADEADAAPRVLAGAVACFAALESWLAGPGVLDGAVAA